MDNKQIEMPKKKEIIEDELGCVTSHTDEGYNLCHDEFTAWLAGRVEKLEKSIEQALLSKINLIGENEHSYYGYPAELIKVLATAIKTMILGEKGL